MEAEQPPRERIVYVGDSNRVWYGRIIVAFVLGVVPDLEANQVTTVFTNVLVADSVARNGALSLTPLRPRRPRLADLGGFEPTDRRVPD
ncbi:MAG: hypothetical protein QM655_15220 [Nocardioidaceae bacterium]